MGFNNGARVSSYIVILSMALVAMGAGLSEAHAQQEALLVPVDGFLTDRQSRPVDEVTEVTFSLYASASAAEAFWSETHQLDVDGGAFAAYLGTYQALSAQDFADHRSPYLAMQIEGDSEMDRWPLGSVPYAAVAHRADDATTLQGMGPDELGGASMAGAVAFDDAQAGLGADTSQAAIEALVARLEAAEAQLATHQSQLAAQGTAISNLESDMATHQGNLVALESDVSTNSNGISSLGNDLIDQATLLTAVEQDMSQVQTTIEPMTRMDVNGQDSLVFDSVNIHIRSGEGMTDGTVNGQGNLIVGYDEGNSADKTGSHNIIFGKNATYKSYGGLVGGIDNTIDGAFASVISGRSNEVTGAQSVIVAASSSRASALGSVVVGGTGGESSSTRSVVTGGWNNTASGSWSVVSGGNNVEESRVDYWRAGSLSSRDQ